MKKLSSLSHEIQNTSQVQHHQQLQSYMLCGRDHTAMCCAESIAGRKSIIWEIKASQATMGISIKDGSFIQAWDKLDHQIQQ